MEGRGLEAAPMAYCCYVLARTDLTRTSEPPMPYSSVETLGSDSKCLAARSLDAVHGTEFVLL